MVAVLLGLTRAISLMAVAMVAAKRAVGWAESPHCPVMGSSGGGDGDGCVGGGGEGDRGDGAGVEGGLASAQEARRMCPGPAAVRAAAVMDSADGGGRVGGGG